MANSLIPAPAIHTNTLPRWASLLLAAACIAIGLWASVVTLQFFEHGAAALESDPALQALAKAAAYLFVFAEMSAFILAALIVGRELMVRRVSLYAYAAVVLIVEVFTISAIQIATVIGADMTQASVAESVIDLRKQIAAAEAQAATYTANAASLRANDQLKKAAQQTDKATAAQDKAAALYAQLGTARDAKRPTLSAMLGETLAIGYAIVRGLLVPATGLIFFGVAGALMLRRADGLSVEDRILMALSRVEGAPAAMPVAMQALAVAPGALRDEPRSFGTAGAAMPKGGLSYSSKTALVGAGLLGALSAAPVVQAAPAPVHEKAPAVPAERVNDDTSAPMKTGVSAPVNGDVLTSPKHVNDDMAERVNDDTPEAPTKARKERVARDGAVMDSGTGQLDGFRYRRGVAGVKAGKIQPTYAGMYEGLGVTAPTAKRFLEAMANAGVVVRKGNRYFLAEKYQAKLVKGGSK